jgi:hypothetical protein
LVAQNHDLELALTATAGEQTNANAKEPVQQTGQQDAQSEPPQPRSSAPPSQPNRVSLPHTLLGRRLGGRLDRRRLTSLFAALLVCVAVLLVVENARALA